LCADLSGEATELTLRISTSAIDRSTRWTSYKLSGEGSDVTSAVEGMSAVRKH